MKKSIKTIAFALLTVGMLAGCQPKPSPVSKNWDDDTQKAMNLFFGEVLPFVELNAETTYVDVSYDAGLVEFVVGDDSEVNVMEGYDSKLTAAGWTLTSMEGEDYYIKENDAGYQMILEYGYYEATEEHAAGNEIYVMSLLPDFKEWNEDLVHLIFAINDKEYNYFQTPAFEAANATFLVDTYVQDYGFMQPSYVTKVGQLLLLMKVLSPPKKQSLKSMVSLQLDSSLTTEKKAMATFMSSHYSQFLLFQQKHSQQTKSLPDLLS